MWVDIHLVILLYENVTITISYKHWLGLGLTLVYMHKHVSVQNNKYGKVTINLLSVKWTRLFLNQTIYPT